MKGQASLLTVVGFVVVFVMFVVALYPIMKGILDADTVMSSDEKALFAMIPMAMFIAFLIGIIYWVFFRRTEQQVVYVRSGRR